MTAINIILSADAVHVLADGAVLNADGLIHGIAPKGLILSHLNAVIAARGARIALPMIYGAIIDELSLASFDELYAGFSFIAKTVWNQPVMQEMLNQNPFGAQAELYLAGWSESRGPAALRTSSTDWVDIPLDNVNVTPCDEVVFEQLKAEVPNAFEIE